MASVTEERRANAALLDPIPAVAVAKAYNAMELAIRLAALRVGLAGLEAEPAALLADLVAQHSVPSQVLAMYGVLADAHRRAVAREAEPTPQEAHDYHHYVQTVVRAVNSAR